MKIVFMLVMCFCSTFLNSMGSDDPDAYEMVELGQDGRAVEAAGTPEEIAIAAPALTHIFKNRKFVIGLIAGTLVGAVTPVVVCCACAGALVLTAAIWLKKSSEGYPEVVTDPSGYWLAASSAGLGGSINAFDADGDYYFKYGPKSGQDFNTTTLSRFDGVDVSKAILNVVYDLQPETEYRYQLIFCPDHEDCIVSKSEGSFTTLKQPVLVLADTATVSANALTITGTVNPESCQTILYWFEYSASESSRYENSTDVRLLTPAATDQPQAVQATISGLESSTSYLVRLVAREQVSGTTYYTVGRYFATGN